MEGRLSTAATSDLHVHVDGCGPCRALLREVGGTLSEIGPADAAPVTSLPASPPPPASVDGDEAPRRPRRVSLRPGERVGPYRALRQIGAGGMGVVFEAEHEEVRRRVAVKVLYPHYSENPEMVARLLNEARAANIVRHPAVVSSFEVGHLPGGEAYLVMEYLDGESLRLRLRRLGGRLGPGDLGVLRQVASAVGVAHAWGVVHRDLKPGNVMLVRDPETRGGERVKILDFGLAKLGAELHDDGAEYSTQAGAILGTPAYMAPEQCQAAAAACDRSDVYSLGVMLFEAVSGRLPFTGRGAVDLMAKHIHVPAPSLRELAPEAPEALVALVARMLQKAPAERPAMTEVAAELERLEALAEGAALSGEGDGAVGESSSPLLTIPAQAASAEASLARGPRRRRAAPWLASAAVAAIVLAGLWLSRGGRSGVAATLSSRAEGAAPAPIVPLVAAPAPSPAAPAAPPAAPSLPSAPSPSAGGAGRRAEAPRRAEAGRRTDVPRRATPPQEDWTDEKIRIFR